MVSRQSNDGRSHLFFRAGIWMDRTRGYLRSIALGFRLVISSTREMRSHFVTPHTEESDVVAELHLAVEDGLEALERHQPRLHEAATKLRLWKAPDNRTDQVMSTTRVHGRRHRQAEED